MVTLVTLVMVISVYFTGEEARSCRLSTTVTRCLRHSQVSTRCVYLSTRWVFATPLFLSVHLCSANIIIIYTWARSNHTCINLKVRSAVKSHNTFFVIYSCQGRWGSILYNGGQARVLATNKAPFPSDKRRLPGNNLLFASQCMNLTVSFPNPPAFLSGWDPHVQNFYHSYHLLQILCKKKILKISTQSMR